MSQTTILVASDAKWVRDQARAAFVGPGQVVVECTRGQDVRAAFAEHEPDLVLLDLQIGNMGGIAVATDLRLEESAGRLPRATILLLLDREADRFLAARADADGELVKPVDAGMLRRTAKVLLEQRDAEPEAPAEATAGTEASDDTDDTDDTDDDDATTDGAAAAPDAVGA